jgi:hypothetical protein
MSDDTVAAPAPAKVTRKVIAATTGSAGGSTVGIALAGPFTNVIAWVLSLKGVMMPDGVQQSVSAIFTVVFTVAATFLAAWFTPNKDA